LVDILAGHLLESRKTLSKIMAIPAKIPETQAEITDYWFLQILELRDRVAQRLDVEGDYRELDSLLRSLKASIEKEFSRSGK